MSSQTPPPNQPMPPRRPAPGEGEPTEPTAPWRTRLRLVILPAIAILVVVFLVLSGARPTRLAVEEAETAVRVVEAIQGTVVPRALGFGTVVPATEWSAVAEVGGRVVYRHPDLRPGSLIREGTEIIRLDAVDYELAVSRLEANIRSSEAALAQLTQEEENTAQSLKIEERALALSQKDLERQLELRERGTTSQAAVDNQERALLTQRQSVQSLRNQLALLPSQRALRQAELDLARAQLAEAKRDLDRTVITLPLNARIQSVTAELDQVVTVGQTMVEADGLEAVEVTAQLPLGRIVPLIPQMPETPIAAADFFSQGSGATPLLERLGWRALVKLSADRVSASWDARVARLAESVDPETRTVGIVVAVDNPYEQAEAGRRPLLTRNMYVSVEIIGTPQADQLVVPAAGLHGERLYVVTEDDRLEIRPVEVRFRQGPLASVEGGVAPGERIVVSDLIPATPAMKLRPALDEDATADLMAVMAGEGDLR
ncbi:MAG: efflux RND transporter periplasmic adaptor subunit [Alphaproteobacteria bacterium]